MRHESAHVKRGLPLLFLVLTLGCGGGNRPAEGQPRSYSEKSLAAALRRELTPEETPLLVSLLANTPEMERRARAMTVAATNDLQRAKVLYDALAGRVSAKPVHGRRYRTAQEVFAAWDVPGEPFLCQELTYLYVSLARAVNLKAYTVFVEQDCFDAWNYHACAAVFVDGKAMLVDPTYSRFDAGHKRFTILDDLQSCALFLSGMVDKAESCESACKLAPTLPIVQVSFFDKLAGERRWKEARDHLEVLLRLEPQGPMTYYAQAVMTFHDGKPDQAAKLLGEAVRLAPHMPQLQAMLGYILVTEGKLVEARQCYEEALRCSFDERSVAWAKQALADIETRLEGTNDTQPEGLSQEGLNR